MSLPRDIVDVQKRPVSLLKLLGRGGEGAVYEIVGDSHRAAKIYFSEKALLRREKILSMAQAQLYRSASSVAYPISPLFRSNGSFAGFTMEKVAGKRPIHELYSPSSRRNHFTNANFRFLVRAAVNISGAVSDVHSSGCVIGDINHSGFLISQDARATLIDADSFQFASGNNLYLCTVGVPDFTPPELQGKRFDQVARTVNHDSFGLGVLIFSLLFMGRHPFVGDYLGTGAPPIERAIAEYRFAYSSDRKRTGMEAPPHVPSLTDLPPSLANAFEISFSPNASRGSRPTAAEWTRLLHDAELDLIQCQSSSGHHYFKNARTCPWCRMERGFPGFVAFATPIHIDKSTPVDLSSLIAAIRAVPDPGIAPPLVASMPVVQPVTNTAHLHPEQDLKPFILSTAGALGSIPLFTTQVINPIVALFAFAGCAYVALKTPKQPKLDSHLSNLRAGFKRHEETFSAVVGNRRFVEVRQEAERQIREFGELANDEAKQIADLSRKLRETQLQHFLEGYPIASAKIKGVGGGRKATLRSYGIDNAADVSKHRIEAISGFGPATSGLLIAWRSSLERRFVFNPTQPINPADVAKIKAQVAQRRSSLDQALRARLTELRTAAAGIQQSRTSAINAASAVWRDLKQAEFDKQALPTQHNLTRCRALFAGLSAAVFLTSVVLSDKAPATSPTSPAPIALNSRAVPTATVPSPTPSVSNLLSPLSLAPPLKPAETTPTPILPPLNYVTPATGATIVPAPSPEITSKLSAPLPLTPPGGQNVAMNSQSAGPEPARPESPDIPFLVNKLRELGYLDATPASSIQIKQAVRGLKIINGLRANDDLDSDAVRLLNSGSAIQARQSFLGRWSTSNACASGVEMEFNAVEAKTDAGACRLNRIEPDVKGWKVQARCQVGPDSWTANIKLQVSGPRLDWRSEKGHQTYYRCP